MHPEWEYVTHSRIAIASEMRGVAFPEESPLDILPYTYFQSVPQDSEEACPYIQYSLILLFWFSVILLHCSLSCKMLSIATSPLSH